MIGSQNSYAASVRTTWKCSQIIGALIPSQVNFMLFESIFFSLNLIEKQKKLYSLLIPPDKSLTTDLNGETIKTEVEDHLSIADDIFVDCTTLLSNEYLKLEVPEESPETIRLLKTGDEAELNDKEHLELLAEFKTILKKRKSKK